MTWPGSSSSRWPTAATSTWPRWAPSLAILGAVIVVRWLGIRYGPVYLLLGVAAWVAFFESGADPVVGQDLGGPAVPFGLTPREQEVLRLVAFGRSNGDIATELFISRPTASVHVSNILGKLGVSSRGRSRGHRAPAAPVRPALTVTVRSRPSRRAVATRTVRSRKIRQPGSQQVPVPVAEQCHGGGQQDAADDGGVDEDGGGHADAEHLEGDVQQGGEDGEHGHHDHRGAGDHAGAAGDAAGDGAGGGGAAVPPFADVPEDEHVVVHRQPEHQVLARREWSRSPADWRA